MDISWENLLDERIEGDQWTGYQNIVENYEGADRIWNSHSSFCLL